MNNNYKSSYVKIRLAVAGANPNGDPDMDNRPRQLPDGRGIISSNCLKMRTKQEMFKYIQDNRITTRRVARCPEARMTMADIAAEFGRKGISNKDTFKEFVDLNFFGLVAASASLGAGTHGSGFVFFSDAETSENISDFIRDEGIICGTNDEDVDVKSSNSMGRRHRVGSVEAPVFYDFTIVAHWERAKNGVEDIDFEIFFNSIRNLFMNSASEARPVGSMYVVDGITIHNTDFLVVPQKIFDGQEPSKMVIDNPNRFVVEKWAC